MGWFGPQGNCGCCCNVCDDLFDLNWIMSLCLEYTGFGSPLTGSQDAANQDYIDGLNATFANVAVSWSDTTNGGPGGLETWGVKYVSDIDYTNYTIYSTNGTSVFSTVVEATMLTFGAWWDPDAPCNPYWLWLITYYVKNPSADFRGSLNLVNKRVSSSYSEGDDMSPTGLPFSPRFQYPRTQGTDNWRADISDSLALSAQCLNPTDSSIQAELLTRYNPDTAEWPDSIGFSDSVYPLQVQGDLRIANDAGTPTPPPECGI